MVIAAAGDVAASGGGQARTAALLMNLIQNRGVKAILVPGDLAYESGTYDEFMRHYHPTWGQAAIKAITYPAPGTHDYYTQGAKGYFDYFNGVGQDTGRAGKRGEGFYSFDIGAWHIIAINGNDDKCGIVSCFPGSPQYEWLVRDLAANRAKCTLAFWHAPRFHQGTEHVDQPEMQDVWAALYDAGADVVITGHEHNYQQFAGMNKQGNLDRARGIRSFVVGTGGRDEWYDTFNNLHADSFEFRLTRTHGVLEMTLYADRYEWRFVDVDNRERVKGSDVCH